MHNLVPLTTPPFPPHPTPPNKILKKNLSLYNQGFFSLCSEKYPVNLHFAHSLFKS